MNENHNFNHGDELPQILEGEISTENNDNNKDKHHRVSFFNFFIVQDGVISFSLRDLTILCTIVISCSFLTMLYKACSQELL